MTDIEIPETGYETGLACVAQGLRRVARALTREYEAALKPAGLKIGQYTILTALRRPAPVPVTDLAQDLGMDRTTLSKDLKPLERRGLLETRQDPNDARVRLVSLTRKGESLWREAYPLWQRAQKVVHARLGGSDWDTVRDELVKLEGRV